MMATSPMESLSSGFIINITSGIAAWISDNILFYVKV